MKYVFLVCFLLTSSIAFSQTEIITTIPPFKMILKPILGNEGEVTSLLPPGASPHTYEIRPSDMRRAAKAGVLVWGHEHLDEYALKFEHKNRLELVPLIPKEFLLPVTGEIVNGKAEVIGTDAHFWCDPLTVKALLPALVEKLGESESINLETIKQNAQKFSNELDALNEEIAQLLSPVKGRTVILSHPFFQYFFKRYDIELAEVIEKIPGKEPTPRQIKKYVDTAKAANVHAVFDHSQLPDLAAKIVAESAGIKIVRLDPIGGVPGRETYTELIRYNARIVLEALK